MPESTIEWGLTWVRWLQQFSPALDVPMHLLTQFGEATGYLLLIPLLYWSLDRRLAVRVTVLVILSLFVNGWAKVWAAQPRPHDADPLILLLDTATGGGLPSGHTQTSVVLYGYIALWARRWRTPVRRWVTIAAIALLILVPLSRMYLGVHLPTDLVGGYLIGGLLLGAFYRLEPRVSEWLDRSGPFTAMASTTLVPALALLLMPAGLGENIIGGAAYTGAALGYHLLWPPLRGEMTGTPPQRALRWTVGMATTGLLGFVAGYLPGLFAILGYGVVGLWASMGVFWLFIRLGLATARPLRRVRGTRGAP